MYKCVTSQVDSSLTDPYTGSWSPSHIDLCRFKVSVLVLLQWGHQTLSCFGFLTYHHITLMCSPLVMWPKSNHIASFALDLKSTYEGEHMIFCLLSLANLAENDVTLLIGSYKKTIGSKNMVRVFTALSWPFRRNCKWTSNPVHPSHLPPSKERLIPNPVRISSTLLAKHLARAHHIKAARFNNQCLHWC
jgi:hypothetical protein